MSPEKHKHKHHAALLDTQKQAHLEVKQEDSDPNAKIDRLVSLTYDSDPHVRKRAAEELSKIDDPRSIFALLELSYDKDPDIKDLALASLGGFSQEKEAIVDLEKVFEARHDGKVQPEEVMQARQKLLPSIEKLFTNKDPLLKARLMPSLLEKYFSTSQIPHHEAPKPAVQSEPEQEGGDAPSSMELEKIDSDQEEARPHIIDQPSKRLTPKEQAAAAVDFPLPEGMKQKTASPISEIESMLPESASLPDEEDEAISLHPNRIDFYKWAYGLAVDPKMTAAKIRSEEKRLIVQLRKDVELAFRLAIARAKTTGIESLSGVKPGMKKVATFPLLVVSREDAVLNTGKKPFAAAKIMLSDGKHSIPLYIEPHRANGILQGDHVSLHDCKVDFIVETNELVFLTGKKGYITVSK